MSRNCLICLLPLSQVERNMYGLPRVLSDSAGKKGRPTMTIGNVLTASAAINSQKTAIALGEETISYQELDQSVTILAQWFVQRGYRRGDSRRALL